MIPPRDAGARAALIVAVFVAVLLLAAFHGPRHRRYARPPAIRSVANHLAAYRTWEGEGVKGRVLWLFDRRAFVSEKGDAPDEENYLDVAVRRGIVRRVYHFVPGSAWGEVREHLRADPRFSAEGDTFVCPMEEGRLIVTSIEHLPEVDERVLALVNPTSWSGEELHQIGELLRAGRIDTDLALILSPTEFVVPGGRRGTTEEPTPAANVTGGAK